MTNEINKFLITEEESNKRLDVVLADRVEHLTRSNLKKIIESKNVKINNLVALSPSRKVKENDSISINLAQKNNEKIEASNIDLNILYEDNDILVINKPKGMVVHPGSGNYENTLVNALLFKYKKKLSNVNGPARPGLLPDG